MMRHQEDVTALAASRETDVMDVVYTAYIMTETEFRPIHFSVPYTKPQVMLSKKDHDLLAEGRTGTHEVKLSKPRETAAAEQVPKEQQPQATMPPNCSYGHYGWAWCPISSTVSPNTLTTVGEIHSTEGLEAKLVLSVSAKAKIEAGLKTGSDSSGSWGINGSVTMSAATQTTYTLPGTCSFMGCAYGREARTYYKYKYEHAEVYQNGYFQWNQYTVTPVEFVGYGELGNYLGGLDGRDPVQVENNQWGQRVSIGEGVETSNNYSLETVFGMAFEVPTGAGTFSGGVETSWVSSHTIQYKASYQYNRYWLYDLNTGRRMWYAAASDTR